MRFSTLALLLGLVVCSNSSFAQDAAAPAAAEPAANDAAAAADKGLGGKVQAVVETAVDTAEQTADELKQTVDASPQAQEITAGILDPIYKFAELLAHPAIHWFAFALMATGVVSFALQLVIGKLVVLTRMHFSMTEVLGDALGLVISLIGLVLTTQAAAENSSFTQSPASVLSATGVGVVLGVIFYWWGQKQELRAARTTQAKK
ncbi:MAG: hypothetical protein SFV23_24405 [Planctomycetaceae bacterium]|nr:hypothetical protein [Planctomycetaceae bacterium]